MWAIFLWCFFWWCCLQFTTTTRITCLCMNMKGGNHMLLLMWVICIWRCFWWHCLHSTTTIIVCLCMNMLFGAVLLNLTQSLIHTFLPPIACIFQWYRSIILQLEVPIKFYTGALYQDIQIFINICWTKKNHLYHQGIFLLMHIPIRVLISTVLIKVYEVILC
jgi:hypothetical protein